ncbi:glycosyltransferase [Chelativorans sp. Marseille-P2723]|uniref:glycosyltransferase n=1 Tax=Chelativorans sp. Marseille-P2723 TaxID=2709133 RepID=UPI00156F3795|nr:glycosyltransferase [Chelativorans sp. Marseille-P2723]
MLHSKFDEAAHCDHAGDLVVNHVMSSEVKSGIFTDLIRYFQLHSPSAVSHIVSVAPVEGAAIYHYHRPHLERELKPNSVVTVHHDLEDQDPWLAFSAFSDVYRQAGLLVCLCSEQQVWLTNRGFDRTIIIPHGYNPRFLSPVERRLDPNARVVLGLASRRYHRRVKGEALLHEIAKRLDPDRVTISLVGSGRTHDASLLWQYGYEVRVNETLPYRLFQKFYEDIDALLVTSWHEGGPACIPEAVATATPIFSTRVGMALDFVESGVNGEFLTREADRDADLIMRFVTDHALRMELQRGAVLHSKKATPWEKIIERYLQAYRMVLAL